MLSTNIVSIRKASLIVSGHLSDTLQISPENQARDGTPKLPPECTLAKFLVSVPPGEIRTIVGVSITDGRYPSVELPEIELPCSSERCGGGPRWFVSNNRRLPVDDKTQKNEFIRFTCRNCGEKIKTYALFFFLNAGQQTLLAYKFGEYPSFGPPLRAKLIRLVQSDAELLKKAWRAEKLGFGVAAATYYRRVVEKHKNELFDQIIEIAKAENFDAKKIEDLQKARDNSQFSQSLEAVKGAIPESLKILGHNPLSLLHDALSDGIHNLEDQQCLEMAEATRTVLIALSERISLLRKERQEVEEKLKSFFQRK